MKNTVYLLILIIGLFFCSHFLFASYSVKALSQVVLNYQFVLTVWRYSFYILVLLLWRYFIEKIGLKQKWSREVIDYLSNQHLKVLMFFVVIEILFVQLC